LGSGAELSDPARRRSFDAWVVGCASCSGGRYLRIRAKLIAASGAEKTCKVTATSVGDGTKSDVVKATLIVR
jgi:hypothetical protein